MSGISSLCIAVNPAIPPMTGKEFAIITQRANQAGRGTAAWDDYERACEQIELERRYNVQNDLREYDNQKDETVYLSTVERQVRCTAAQTLKACEKPAPTESSSDIEWRLALVCQLLLLLERIEDFRHDFGLLNATSRIADLEGLFREQLRKHAVRYDNGKRLDIILKHTFERFCHDVAQARRIEIDLRGHIKNYSLQEDLESFPQRFEQVIGSAITAALEIESHFEDRIFDQTGEP